MEMQTTQQTWPAVFVKKKKQSKKKRTKKMEHLQVWMWMSVLDTESMSDIKEHLRLHFFLE